MPTQPPIPQGEDDLETFTFGNITIRAPRISEEERLARVQESCEAMARGAKGLLKRGVRIKRQKGVPLYYAAPNEPDVLIQELNGKKTRGHFVGTRFIPEKPKAKRRT